MKSPIPGYELSVYGSKNIDLYILLLDIHVDYNPEDKQNSDYIYEEIELEVHDVEVRTIMAYTYFIFQMIL